MPTSNSNHHIRTGDTSKPHITQTTVPSDLSGPSNASSIKQLGPNKSKKKQLEDYQVQSWNAQRHEQNALISSSISTAAAAAAASAKRNTSFGKSTSQKNHAQGVYNNNTSTNGNNQTTSYQQPSTSGSRDKLQRKLKTTGSTFLKNSELLHEKQKPLTTPNLNPTGSTSASNSLQPTSKTPDLKPLANTESALLQPPQSSISPAASASAAAAFKRRRVLSPAPFASSQTHTFPVSQQKVSAAPDYHSTTVSTSATERSNSLRSVSSMASQESSKDTQSTHTAQLPIGTLHNPANTSPVVSDKPIVPKPILATKDIASIIAEAKLKVAQSSQHPTEPDTTKDEYPFSGKKEASPAAVKASKSVSKHSPPNDAAAAATAAVKAQPKHKKLHPTEKNKHSDSTETTEGANGLEYTNSASSTVNELPDIKNISLPHEVLDFESFGYPNFSLAKTINKRMPSQSPTRSIRRYGSEARHIDIHNPIPKTVSKPAAAHTKNLPQHGNGDENNNDNHNKVLTHSQHPIKIYSPTFVKSSLLNSVPLLQNESGNYELPTSTAQTHDFSSRSPNRFSTSPSSVPTSFHQTHAQLPVRSKTVVTTRSSELLNPNPLRKSNTTGHAHTKSLSFSKHKQQHDNQSSAMSVMPNKSFSTSTGSLHSVYGNTKVNQSGSTSSLDQTSTGRFPQRSNSNSSVKDSEAAALAASNAVIRIMPSKNQSASSLTSQSSNASSTTSNSGLNSNTKKSSQASAYLDVQPPTRPLSTPSTISFYSATSGSSNVSIDDKASTRTYVAVKDRENTEKSPEPIAKTKNDSKDTEHLEKCDKASENPKPRPKSTVASNTSSTQSSNDTSNPSTRNSSSSVSSSTLASRDSTGSKPAKATPSPTTTHTAFDKQKQTKTKKKQASNPNSNTTKTSSQTNQKYTPPPNHASSSTAALTSIQPVNRPLSFHSFSFHNKDPNMGFKTATMRTHRKTKSFHSNGSYPHPVSTNVPMPLYDPNNIPSPRGGNTANVAVGSASITNTSKSGAPHGYFAINHGNESNQSIDIPTTPASLSFVGSSYYDNKPLYSPVSLSSNYPQTQPSVRSAGSSVGDSNGFSSLKKPSNASTEAAKIAASLRSTGSIYSFQNTSGHNLHSNERHSLDRVDRPSSGNNMSLSTNSVILSSTGLPLVAPPSGSAAASGASALINSSVAGVNDTSSGNGGSGRQKNSHGIFGLVKRKLIHGSSNGNGSNTANNQPGHKSNDFSSTGPSATTLSSTGHGIGSTAPAQSLGMIKTTMRKQSHRKSFNEDKPWKHHSDAVILSEAEKKRYEGLWAANKGSHLEMVYAPSAEEVEAKNLAKCQKKEEAKETERTERKERKLREKERLKREQEAKNNDKAINEEKKAEVPKSALEVPENDFVALDKRNTEIASKFQGEEDKDKEDFAYDSHNHLQKIRLDTVSPNNEGTTTADDETDFNEYESSDESEQEEGETEEDDYGEEDDSDDEDEEVEMRLIFAPTPPADLSEAEHNDYEAALETGKSTSLKEAADPDVPLDLTKLSISSPSANNGPHVEQSTQVLQNKPPIVTPLSLPVSSFTVGNAGVSPPTNINPTKSLIMHLDNTFAAKPPTTIRKNSSPSVSPHGSSLDLSSNHFSVTKKKSQSLIHLAPEKVVDMINRPQSASPNFGAQHSGKPVSSLQIVGNDTSSSDTNVDTTRHKKNARSNSENTHRSLIKTADESKKSDSPFSYKPAPTPARLLSGSAASIPGESRKEKIEGGGAPSLKRLPVHRSSSPACSVSSAANSARSSLQQFSRNKSLPSSFVVKPPVAHSFSSPSSNSTSSVALSSQVPSTNITSVNSLLDTHALTSLRGRSKSPLYQIANAASPKPFVGKHTAPQNFQEGEAQLHKDSLQRSQRLQMQVQQEREKAKRAQGEEDREVKSFSKATSTTDVTSPTIAHSLASHYTLDNDPRDHIHGYVVRELWRRSRVPDGTLSQIWDLVDRNHDGTLDRESFLVGIWLVDQCLYGRKLPHKIDDAIWKSVSRLGVTVEIIKTKAKTKKKNKHQRKKKSKSRSSKSVIDDNDNDLNGVNNNAYPAIVNDVIVGQEYPPGAVLSRKEEKQLKRELKKDRKRKKRHIKKFL